ncbi:MAG: hypothetical protein ACKVZH_00755 [Blastocatellia bacterium]
MNDAVAMTIVLLLIGGGLLALQHWLANANRYREEMTEEEYRESVEQGPGLIGNAMMSLDQQIFHRSAERAIEYKIDAEQGQLPGGGGQGECLDGETEDDQQNIKQ